MEEDEGGELAEITRLRDRSGTHLSSEEPFNLVESPACVCFRAGGWEQLM